MSTNKTWTDLKYVDPDIEDWDLWNLKPDYRWTFNKLEVAIRCGYNAAPVPVPVNITGKYCVRPIYNLVGMGIQSSIETLNEGELLQSKHPGMFWCEYFDGPHYSIDYEWQEDHQVGGWWNPIFSTQGFNSDDNLIQFTHWNKIDHPNIKLPSFLNELSGNKVLNIEFKGSKIIEIHLRLGNLAGDWLGLESANTIVPVWDSTTKEKCQQLEKMGYTYINRDADTLGHLKDNRKGFYYK